MVVKIISFPSTNKSINNILVSKLRIHQKYYKASIENNLTLLILANFRNAFFCYISKRVAI